MALRLPRLQATQPIVDDRGLPTMAFQRYIQSFAEQAEGAINDIQAALDAAMLAQATANAAMEDLLLTNSFIDPSSVLTGNPAQIFIAPHTRHYGDGTVKSVNGATIAVPGPPGAIYYVSYSDPNKMGGAVSYVASDIQPNQSGAIHVVGGIFIPTSGTGSGGSGPGGVQP